MCCCCGLRGTTICASIFTLVQSMVGLGFSAFIIVNYTHCIKWLPRDNSLYYFYFYRPECFSPTTTVSREFNYLDRTLTWGKVYVVLNACWLVASFLMAVCSCVKNPKKMATYFLYSPWIFVTIAIIVADVAATIIHFADITNIQDLLNVAADSTAWWNILMGPLVMGLIFSRLFIGWIINFGMLICVSVAVVRLWKDHEGKVLTTMPYGSRNLPGAPPLEEPSWGTGHIPHAGTRPKPGRTYEDSADMNANTRVTDTDRHYMGANVQSLISQQPRVILPDPRYRDAYENREEEKPSKTPKGYLPSGPSSIQDDKDVRAGRQRPIYSTAVRSQLPWSYFQNPADSRHPVLKQPGVDDDQDRPPVPVPDYTLHIGKRPKTGSAEVSRSGSDASSSGNTSRPRAAVDARLKSSSREADVLY